MKRDTGFGVVGLIAVTAALALIGIITWRLYDMSRQPVSSSQSATPNAGYLVIEEWNVRLKPTENLQDLEVASRPSQIPQAEEMMFITDDMLKLDAACSGETEGSRPLGALIRAQDQIEQPGNKQFLKEIAGYYFYYYAPASSCSPETEVEEIQSTNLEKVKNSLSSLEAAA